MKIEELTQKQIDRAKSLATNEERVAYLKECGVELEDDSLTAVAGGRGDRRDESDDCKKNPSGSAFHKWKKTGRKKSGRWIGIVDDVEYKCEYCGKTYWGLW